MKWLKLKDCIPRRRRGRQTRDDDSVEASPPPAVPSKKMNRSVNIEMITSVLHPGTLVLFYGRGDPAQARCRVFRSRRPSPQACLQVGVVVVVDGVPMIAEGNNADSVRFYPAELILRWRLAHDMELTSIYLRQPRFTSPSLEANLHLHLEALVAEHRHRAGASAPASPSSDTSASYFFAVPTASDADPAFINVVLQASGLLATAAVSLPLTATALAQPWTRLRGLADWRPGFSFTDGCHVETADDWALEWDGEAVAATKEYRRASVDTEASAPFRGVSPSAGIVGPSGVTLEV